MKILVGAFQCESNTFSAAKAGKENFYILHGEEAKHKLFASHLFEEAAQPRAQSLQLSQNFCSRPYYNGRMKFIGMLLLSHQKITITFSILPIYFYTKKHQLKCISDQSSPSILLLYCQEFSH